MGKIRYCLGETDALLRGPEMAAEWGCAVAVICSPSISGPDYEVCVPDEFFIRPLDTVTDDEIVVAEFQQRGNCS